MKTTTTPQTNRSTLNFGNDKRNHRLNGAAATVSAAAVALAIIFGPTTAQGQTALGKIDPINTLSGTANTTTHTTGIELVDPDLSHGPVLDLPEEAENERDGLSYSVGPYDFTELENFTRTPTELTAETLNLPSTIIVTAEGESQQPEEGEEAALDAVAYAPLNLPDEAPVYGMSIFVHDSCLNESITVKLKRRSLTSGVTQTLIEVSSSSGGAITTSDAEIFEPIPESLCDSSSTSHLHTADTSHMHFVNNDNNYYYLEVTSPERTNPVSTGQLKLYGAIIDYFDLEE